MTAASRRRWMTAIKRARKERAQRVLDYQLTPREIHALMSAQRQVSKASMARALGVPLRAPYFNPSGGLRMMRRRWNTSPAPSSPPGHRKPPAPKPSSRPVRQLGMAARARARGHTSKRGRTFQTPAESLGALQGPIMAGQTRSDRGRPGGLRRSTQHRERAKRVRVLGPLMPGQTRYRWVDADGNQIKGASRWKGFHRGGLTFSGQRPGKKKKAKKRRRTLGVSKSAKRRRLPSRALMREVIGAMQKGRVRYTVRTSGSSKGYTLRSSRRGKVPTRKMFRAALNRMPRGRVIVRVAGGGGQRGYTIRNPGGGAMRFNGRRRRRRNPGFDIMGIARQLMSAAIPAVAGGAALSLFDTKVLAGKSPAIRYAGKIGAAAAVALLLRSRPDTARLVMGAVFGSLGYDLGTKLGGPGSTLGQIAYLVAADRQAMSALIDSSGAAQTVPSLNGLPPTGMSGPPDVSIG
jgi:hypothetical protein